MKHKIWIIFIFSLWLALFAITLYQYTQGVQPDNFRIMLILILTIYFQGSLNSEQNQ